MQIAAFSKHLAGLPLEEVAARLSAMGIQAVDLTVRPGGHVEPERVEDELPAAEQALATAGVSVAMITTAIIDAHPPVTARILHTAAELGIRYYKIGYYFYSGFGSWRKEREEAARKVSDLASLNNSIGIHGGLHNHSGDFIGALPGDLAYLLEGGSPEEIGCYFDGAHATIEGGLGGWRLALDILIDRITMLAVKDYRWIDDNPQQGTVRLHSPQFCPLENGNTPWPEILAILRRRNFDGPISLHSEYQGPSSFADLSVDGVIEQTGRDAIVLREWMQGAGYKP